MILSDIPAEKSGVASGTNSTVRQVGAALGVAVIGSVFASLTVSRTVDAVKSAALPASLRDTAVGRGARAGCVVPGAARRGGVDAAALSNALATGITEAVRRPCCSRPASSWWARSCRSSCPARRRSRVTHEPLVEALVAIEPVEPDPATVLSRDR